MAERASMTPTQGRLADHCLAHPLAAGTMGIEELAAAADVSIATVSRFTRILGFDSHAEFRSCAVADIKRLMSPEEKLEEEKGSPREDLEIVRESLDAAIWDLQRATETLDEKSWTAAASAIRSASNVVFIGFGVSAFLVDLLADMVAAFCRAQTIVDGRGGHERIIRRTQFVGPEDLVVAIALPRYSRATIEHTEQMKSQGAKVLVITDVETSPLVSLADIALLTDAHHPLLHASVTPVVAVFEALRSILTARGQDPVVIAELSRRLRPYLHPDRATSDEGLPK